MTLNKKILVAAIVGSLFGANAFAAPVNLSDPDGSTPVTLAAEEDFDTDGELVTTAATDVFELEFETGYAFSDQEVRYARIECSDNMALNVVGADVTSSVTTDLSVGNINGSGTNVIRFSLTANDALSDNVVVNVAGTRTFTSRDAVTCSYSLYDLPSQAAAGGSAGRIVSVSDSYAVFSNSYRYRNTTATDVANVEANPSFSRFTTEVGGADANNGFIGQLRFGVNGAVSVTGQVTPVLSTGTAVTLGNILGGDTAHVVSGDFSNAIDAAGDFNPDLVFFATAATCPTAGAVFADAVTANSATFEIGAASVGFTGAAALPGGAFLCYAPRAGIAIPVSDYSISLVADSNTGFTASQPGPAALGSIVRNGTSFQAQFAQVPPGWISRIVLTNTGAVARPYTITAQTETGNTATLGSAAAGTIPARSTIVLNTSDIVTFSGNPRGTLNVAIAAPNTQVQGLYQIVNGATGSIANTALVRPGTN